MLRDWIDFATTHGRMAVAMAAALLYGVVRVAIEAFYAQFRVAPEDVGISQARILGRAAIFFVFFLAGLAAVTNGAMAAALLIRRNTRKGNPTSRDGYQTAALALWGVFAALALLPILLCLAVPELAAFLLGYVDRNGAVQPPYLRMSCGAWCAAMALFAFAALHTANRKWMHEVAPPRWRWTSAAVFLPWLSALVVLSSRGRLHVVWIDAVVVVWPVAALLVVIALVTLWRTPLDSDRGTGLAYIAASLCFYTILLPLLLSVVDQKPLRSFFPNSGTLFDAGQDSVAKRLRLLFSFWPIGVAALMVFACACLVRRWDEEKTVRVAIPPESATSAAFLITLASVIALCLLLLAHARGEVMAARVMSGQRFRTSEGLLVASAEPACVGGVAGLTSPGPWMLVGSTSATVVLYGPLDPTTDGGASVVSVPSSGASLDLIGTDVASTAERTTAAAVCASFAHRSAPLQDSSTTP